LQEIYAFFLAAEGCEQVETTTRYNEYGDNDDAKISKQPKEDRIADPKKQEILLITVQ